MKRLLASLSLLVVMAPATACLWDSDTLATEAKGFPGIAEILTGRFERPPPLYYEARLARVTGAIAVNPAKLEDHDDAAVSCDRLGRGDEGIEWLRRKKVQLGKLEPVVAREHLYRYEANLGSLLAHRWFRAGARRDAMQDLKEGRTHIAAAIDINPDAHFGREKYQLMAMDWLLDDPPSAGHSRLPSLLDRAGPSPSSPESVHWSRPPVPPGAAEGLAGLIVLGSAWENFDITYAFGLALQARGDASLARLAGFRCDELLDAGHSSIHPRSPELAIIRSEVEMLGFSVRDPEPIQRYYREARSAAEAWAKHRTEFMQTRLQAGLHPDTHPDFWKGYVEPTALPFPFPTWRHLLHDEDARTAAFAGGALLIVLILANAALRQFRGRKRSGKSVSL